MSKFFSRKSHFESSSVSGLLPQGDRLLVKLDEASRTARVESAVALSKAQQEDVRNSLKLLKSGDVTVDFDTNPGLIGGMRIKIGDDVYDGSVKTRLTSLSDNF